MSESAEISGFYRDAYVNNIPGAVDHNFMTTARPVLRSEFEFFHRDGQNYPSWQAYLEVTFGLHCRCVASFFLAKRLLALILSKLQCSW